MDSPHIQMLVTDAFINRVETMLSPQQYVRVRDSFSRLQDDSEQRGTGEASLVIRAPKPWNLKPYNRGAGEASLVIRTAHLIHAPSNISPTLYTHMADADL
jgi:hypothetical protein